MFKVVLFRKNPLWLLSILLIIFLIALTLGIPSKYVNKDQKFTSAGTNFYNAHEVNLVLEKKTIVDLGDKLLSIAVVVPAPGFNLGFNLAKLDLLQGLFSSLKSKGQLVKIDGKTYLFFKTKKIKKTSKKYKELKAAIKRVPKGILVDSEGRVFGSSKSLNKTKTKHLFSLIHLNKHFYSLEFKKLVKDKELRMPISLKIKKSKLIIKKKKWTSSIRDVLILLRTKSSPSEYTLINVLLNNSDNLGFVTLNKLFDCAGGNQTACKDLEELLIRYFCAEEFNKIQRSTNWKHPALPKLPDDPDEIKNMLCSTLFDNEPLASDTPKESETPSETPTDTPTDTPSATPTDTPYGSPTDTPIDTPSETPMPEPSSAITPTTSPDYWWSPVPTSSESPNPSLTQCGNNQIEDDEECDDGNTESGDGCSKNCETECIPTSPEKIEKEQVLYTSGSKNWKTDGSNSVQIHVKYPKTTVEVDCKDEDGDEEPDNELEDEVYWKKNQQGPNGICLDPSSDKIIALNKTLAAEYGVTLGDLVLVAYNLPADSPHTFLQRTTWTYAFVGKITSTSTKLFLSEAVISSLNYPSTKQTSIFIPEVTLFVFKNTGETYYCLKPEGAHPDAEFPDDNKDLTSFGEESHNLLSPTIDFSVLPKEKKVYKPITPAELKIITAHQYISKSSAWVSKDSTAIGLKVTDKTKVDADGSHFDYKGANRKASIIEKIKFLRKRYGVPLYPPKGYQAPDEILDIFRHEQYGDGTTKAILDGILDHTPEGNEWDKWSSGSQQDGTTLAWSSNDPDSHRHFPNADTLPYIVIPEDWYNNSAVLAYTGDLALICHEHNGRRCIYAIIADGGGVTKFGEVSLFGVEYLRFPTITPNDANGLNVEFLVFPGSHVGLNGCITAKRTTGWKSCSRLTAQEIQDQGKQVCESVLGKGVCPSVTLSIS